MSTVSVRPVATAPEAVQLGNVIVQCFNFSLEGWETYVQRLGRQNLRVVCQNQSIAGGLALYPMGQWFGGQAVPMTGLAAVGILPEHRGTGVAAHLLTQTLQELQDDGIPLATLYASTSRLYRHVGFEQAGTYCRFSVPLQTLSPSHRAKSVDPHALPVTAVEIEDWQPFSPLYEQHAQAINGALDRHPAIWQQILHPGEETVYADLIGPSDCPQGYVIFDQQGVPGSYDLRIRDLVTLSPTAAQRFWTFMTDHRSLASKVYWYGPTLDPLLSLLPEQTYRIEQLERWLLRIVDVAKALTLRGYPDGIEMELHLEVSDPIFPTNTGKFVLQVAGGCGQVFEGGRGDFQLSIRGLSPLYTGLLTPQQIHRLGYGTGSEQALEIAALLFSGPEPWMGDHF